METLIAALPILSLFSGVFCGLVIGLIVCTWLKGRGDATAEKGGDQNGS